MIILGARNGMWLLVLLGPFSFSYGADPLRVPDGRPWEESVYCTLVYTNWQLGTLWSVHSAYSFRDPRGR